MKQIPLLSSEDIEVKIKQCTKTGAVALLYKTARVDYRILDEVFGPLGWQIDYQEIKGNLYCTVSLWDPDNKQWVKKTNCGIESREDGEGNEKKGEASDAAKRAGFVVGIGAELYTAPFIMLEVATTEDKNGKWKLENPYNKYVVTNIQYNKETRVITALTIANEKTGAVVFDWKLPTTGAKAQKMEKTVKGNKAAKEPNPQPQANTQPKEEKASEEPKMALTALKKEIQGIVLKIGKAKYDEVVKKVTGDIIFRCNKATDEQYNTVLSIYKELVAAGYDK